MATVNDAITQSKVGVDGNSYTTRVSKDKLTNEDFLKLMLEEMKQQDPTKPMDSKALMDSQLKMSSIQANQDMSSSLKELQASYATSALSNAANMIGHHVKDGSKDAKGSDKSYAVETVENKNGILYLKTKEATGVKDALKLVDGGKETYLDYDTNGFILQNNAHVEGDIKVSIDPATKRFEYNTDGSLKLLDANNAVVTDQDIKDKYKFATTFPIYSKEVTTIALNSVIEVK